MLFVEGKCIANSGRLIILPSEWVDIDFPLHHTKVSES